MNTRSAIGLLALFLSCASNAQTPPPDNTGTNARDAHAASSTTPIDQSNAKADIQLLAAVRKAIVSDSSLSSNAHNVKILTSNGSVLLRGPVKTADEKDKVGTLAKNVAGVTAVDNQLDVKGATP